MTDEKGKTEELEPCEELGEDVLRAPTYGVLIAIVDPGAVEALSRNCREVGYPFASVGTVKSGGDVYVDGLKIKGLERVAIDALYGKYEGSRP